MKKINLQLFGAGEVVHTTTGVTNSVSNSHSNYGQTSGLSGEMKTFYSDYLIDMAEPKLVHDQFGQKCPIPKNNGKVIEFRKYDPLPKMTQPLSEGVTPDGQKIQMGVVSAEVKQYGGYVELSDLLQMTAIDNNLVQATKLLGGQAGRTLDTITREVLSGGTNVQFAEGQAEARYELMGGKNSGNHYLTVDAVRKAVRYLKTMNAETINGSYVGIIHPDVAYDLMSDPKWVNVKTYSDPEGIYMGEIGKIENVRFVESSEAKIFKPECVLTVKTVGQSSITVEEKIDSALASALTNDYSMVFCDVSSGDTESVEITAVSSGNAGSATITLSSNPTGIAAGDIICTKDAGFGGRNVYSTLIIGENAYGTTEIAGGGLQHITKQLGSAGTGDPLNQRATAGWKATKAAVRLVEPYMVRIETTSTFNE